MPIYRNPLVNRLHSKWGAMRSRCENPKNTDFQYYGAKGITVCPLWKDFPMFFAWALPNYSPELVLDRINPDGPYAPWNCQWITPEENSKRASQHKKRRSGAGRNLIEAEVLYIHSQPNKGASQLARELGVNRGTVWHVRSGATHPELHPGLAGKEYTPGGPARKRLEWNGDVSPRDEKGRYLKMDK